MTKTFFIFLSISLFYSSCSKKNDNLPLHTTGKINTVFVLIDDQLWFGEIGDSIRNKFATPVLGLPQEEPLFTINQYPVKPLEGFMTNSRTILVVKKGEGTKFEIKKNQYASPQYVFHISGKTNSEILEMIEKNTPKIIQIIKQTEINESQRIINQSILDSKKISDTFHISLKVPSSYTYMLQKNNFIWLKKEITSGSNSLLIYQVPLSTIKKRTSIISNIIRIRDSIGELYISGTDPDTYMLTEKSYSPYLFKLKLDGKTTYEARGSWELKNDFMSGPFINYAIIDKEHNRVLFLEGFCYSPSKEKRDFMHELESIIKSVAFEKQ